MGSHIRYDRESGSDLHRSEDQPLLGPPCTAASGNLIIFCTVLVLFVNCAINGLVTLSITQISSEYDLDPGIELWPMSTHYLAQGCTFLLAGSWTDVLGSRRAFLSGCLIQTTCYLASGFSRSGMQLISFRILSGIAYPMCFVSAMNIQRECLPTGKLHNRAISYTRGSQYLGSATGIVLGGLFSVCASWRWGFHCATVLQFSILLLSIWAIPREVEVKRISWASITENIDWAGTLLASFLMTLLFFALAVITNNVAVLAKSGLFIPLALGWVLLIAFLFWHDCWERDSTQGVQDSLWTNSNFLSIGLVVFFIYASSHSTSQLIVLVFQRAQGLSISQTSWQILPIPIIGALSSTFVANILPRARTNDVLIVTILISSLGPLLMFLLDIDWAYWKCAMFAVSFTSVASSSIIPIAANMISETLPFEMQGFAIGVMCTIAMIGTSVGMALAALISNDVTASELQSLDGRTSPGSDAWMSGYRAAFSFFLLLNFVGLFITVICLRKIGYLGRLSNTGQ